jgi:CYTH domain-containing protein
MGIEIERRFLISSSQKRVWDGDSLQIRQFYVDKEIVSHLIPTNIDVSMVHVWRIRSSQHACFLTGKGRRTGATGVEFEWEISREEFNIIEGTHNGLIIAEVELDTEDQLVQLPEWLGKEITGDNSWSNWSLSQMTKP